MRVMCRIGVVASILCLPWASSGGHVGAQTLSEVALACGAASEAQLAWCQETALAVQSAQAALGLSASGGIDLPGSASTLGWRTKGSPRFALSIWGSVTRAPMPAMEVREGLPGGEDNPTFPGFHVSGTAGVFDGFSLGPTVGGVGSLDLTLSGQWIGTPSENGFRDSARGWGGGARVGIIRESFSLPGISLSGFYRSLGNHDLWSIDEGDPSEASFELGVSSLRGLVGKDIHGIGFFGGAGWDRYSGNATILVDALQAGGLAGIGTGKLESDRHLFFVGASMTFLTLQLSAEAGWADGLDLSLPVAGERSFDPGAHSTFGSLALRLTF